jgi:hypothetical protein
VKAGQVAGEGGQPDEASPTRLMAVRPSKMRAWAMMAMTTGVTPYSRSVATGVVP